MPTVLYETKEIHPDELTGIVISETKICGLINSSPLRRENMPFEQIDLYTNNNRTIRVFVKNEDLNIVNLVGAIGVLTVKVSKTSATTTLSKSTSVSGQGELGAADEGEMFFYILPADTATLEVRQYVYDVKVTLQSGKKYTVLEGVINLEKSVG